MQCLQWLSGRPRQYPSEPLIGEVVGSVSPATAFAVCCAHTSQALRMSPPAVSFGTQHIEVPAQVDVRVLSIPSPEYDWATGAWYVDAPAYSGSWFLQGGKYYEIEYPERLQLCVSTNVSTRFSGV